jgi:hypothetical protein
MPVPTTQRWNESVESFNEVCQMPNCIGSVDGKHCAKNAHPMQVHNIIITNIFILLF